MSRAALPFSRPSWARQRSAPRSAAQSSSSSKSSRRSRTMFSTRAGLASMVIDGLQKRKTRLTGGFGTVGWGCGSDGQAGAPAGGLVDGEHVLVLDEAGPADLWDVVFPSARDARGDEPPRLFRRLHFLRGWSYEEVYEIFARSPRTRGAHGVRARERVPVAVGGDRIDRVKDWVHGRDVARLGASS